MGKSLSAYHPFSVILLISVSLSISHGLQCWICTNVRSLAECKKDGHLRTCQTGQEMVCATEIRRHRGFRGHPSITKRCKQSQACENGKRQNKSQCRGPPRNSVCRCCCKGDRCNLNNLGCRPTVSVSKGQTRCHVPPQAPINGEMECNYKKVLGEINSSCMFSCDEGYVLNGRGTSICLRRSSSSIPTFTPAPTCVPSEDAFVTITMTTGMQSPQPPTEQTTQSVSSDICLVIPASSAMGGRSCINVQTGVVCTYFCPSGVELIGSAVITCTNDTGWSAGPPKCGHHCRDIGSAPVNGMHKCVGVGRVGTYCTFSCDPGHRLVGTASLECVNNTGKPSWNDTLPFCRIDVPK